MRLEYHNGKIRADRYHHQRKEQIIPASQFCNQKIPVSGACITPDINPAIPNKAKFFSGI